MIKKIIKYIFVCIILLCIGFYFLVQNKKPTYNGTLELSTLKESVNVYFDEVGVPHIYASNQEDAYQALGYVHAQDRLWQMELIRRIAAGRLSEIFGKDLIETDKLFKGIGIPYISEKEIEKLDTTAVSYKLTQAYLKGINAFIDNGPTPIEFTIVGVKKEHYNIHDVYHVFGYMAFGFAQAHKTDPLLSNLRENLGEQYLKDLAIDINPKSTLIKNYPKRKQKTIASNIASSVQNALENSPIPSFIGSNSWVVGPRKTKHKKVILSNDPHIGFAQPAVWYQSHIVTPEYEMYGFNLALTPFPFLGHNRDYAYGITMFENDDIDFYQESDTLSFTKRKEIIKVKGEEDVQFEVQLSPNGPIMNDFLQTIDGDNPIAMDWVFTKLDQDILEASYSISHANSLTEFKAGAEKIYAPGLNLMYGDAKGNIAWFAAAKLYHRTNSAHTKFILQGDNPDDTTLNYYKFEDNPQAVNPKSGYVYSANNQPEQINGAFYPGYYLPEDRAKRIVNLLDSKNDFTKEDMQKMMNDVQSSVAPELILIIIKELSKVNLTTNEKKAVKILESWKGDFKQNQVAPTIYNKFIYLMFKNTFEDEMGKAGLEQFFQTHIYKRQIAKQLKTRKSVWWDNINTKEIKEQRDEIITTSFHQAIKSLENQFGEDIENWHWNKALTVTHKHAFDKVASLRRFFNVGPFKTDGGNEVINNQLFKINETGEYQVTAGPSTRRIIDFNDIENSLAILPTGQSGNVFSKHYKDQAEKYINGEFVKMKLNKAEIELLEDKLVFIPKKKE